MTNDFDEVMSKRTDAELLKILNSPEGDYQPIALEAAKREFAKRNLSENQVSTAKQEMEENQKIKDKKANVPLWIGWKILTAIFPSILQLFFAGSYRDYGYDRKANELFTWTLYGFGFYALIATVIGLLEFVF
jgi:hypothetical protein